MPAASGLAWKTSRKVRTLWHCNVQERDALPMMIVVISVRQSTVAAISGLHCRALVMVGLWPRADKLIAKFKEAGGTVREIDVWAESPRLSHLNYLHHRLPVVTGSNYRDNAVPAKPSATKMPENWSWRTRQLLTCRCVSVMFALDAKYTKELADAKKAESQKVLCVMMLPLVVVGCTSKQSVGQCVKYHRLRRG